MPTLWAASNAVKQAAEAKKEKKAAEKGSASEPGTSNKAGEAKEASAGKESGDALQQCRIGKVSRVCHTGLSMVYRV